MNRRRFLAAGLGGTALAGAAVGGALIGHQRAQVDPRTIRFYGDDMLGKAETRAVWYRYKFVGQPVMDTQVLYYLGLAQNGLTDVGEVLDTALRIRAGDEVSWFEAWTRTARRVQADAEQALQRGHGVSAGTHFLRAGAYWRAALIRYADHTDPRMLDATHAALYCHDRALTLRGYASEAVAIPYEGSVLVGRVHYAGAHRGPFLVVHQGLHAWPEDTMWVIDGALKRGYHVLSFHGPGQGASLRMHGHPFRPDWEVAVGAVLDVAESLPRLDVARSVLMGLSFGGSLAPRAAAFEPRLHALVANPGVLNWGAAMLRHFAELPGLLPMHARSPAAFDAAIATVSKGWPDAAWYFADVTWKHGVDSPHALIDDLRRYDNTDVVGRIGCRTLVMDGVAEDASPGQAKPLYDRLTCPKTYLLFDADSCAQTHCQAGGLALAEARLFDWLDEEVRA